MSLQYQRFVKPAIHVDRILSERISKTFISFHKTSGCFFWRKKFLFNKLIKITFPWKKVNEWRLHVSLCIQNRYTNKCFSSVKRICGAVVLWCSGYHYYTISFNKDLSQVLRRFKFCWRRVRESRCWGSLSMVPAANKAKRLSSVNHTTKTIHHQYFL